MIQKKIDNNNPVDIVYMWVDGSDKKWLEKKNNTLKKYENLASNKEISGKSRFQNRNELKYSLRSVEKFAKWIRNIYIVTDNQKPKWLNHKHPKINIVDHSEIFDEKENLPNFNSNAIEARLHYIEHLSENFLALNDDLFFGRKTSYKDFFINIKTPKLFAEKIDLSKKNSHTCPHEASVLNARNLIFKKYNKMIDWKLHHGIKALNKTEMFELEQKFPKAFTETTNNHFRSFNDVWVFALHAFYSVVTNKNKPFYISTYRRNLFRYNLKIFRKNRDFVFVPLYINKEKIINKFEAIKKYKPLMFCVNDGLNVNEENNEIVIKKLKDIFPEKSEFEK